MAKLTTAARKKIPKKMFGLPKEGKYPMPDRSHAANAKARASQQVKKGNLSSAEKSKIDAKANRILYGESKMPKSNGYDARPKFIKKILKNIKKSNKKSNKKRNAGNPHNDDDNLNRHMNNRY